MFSIAQAAQNQMSRMQNQQQFDRRMDLEEAKWNTSKDIIDYDFGRRKRYDESQENLLGLINQYDQDKNNYTKELEKYKQDNRVKGLFEMFGEKQSMVDPSGATRIISGPDGRPMTVPARVSTPETKGDWKRWFRSWTGSNPKAEDVIGPGPEGPDFRDPNLYKGIGIDQYRSLIDFIENDGDASRGATIDELLEALDIKGVK
tara:strand:+ start:7789 stop:8397 length:609 start_codon:yes stop_codon:yes gene_type:complete